MLKPGGKGIIQHGTLAGRAGGWRSSVTLKDVQQLMSENALCIDAQVLSWRDGEIDYQAGLYEDAITVFHKPAAANRKQATV